MNSGRGLTYDDLVQLLRTEPLGAFFLLVCWGRNSLKTILQLTHNKPLYFTVVEASLWPVWWFIVILWFVTYKSIDDIFSKRNETTVYSYDDTDDRYKIFKQWVHERHYRYLTMTHFDNLYVSNKNLTMSKCGSQLHYDVTIIFFNNIWFSLVVLFIIYPLCRGSF